MRQYRHKYKLQQVLEIPRVASLHHITYSPLLALKETVQHLVHIVKVALDNIKPAMQRSGILVQVNGLLALSIGNCMDATDHHVPADGGIVQVGQVEGAVEVVHQGEGMTSVQVGLLGKHLIDGPCNGRVRSADKAMLQRGGHSTEARTSNWE